MTWTYRLHTLSLACLLACGGGGKTSDTGTGTGTGSTSATGGTTAATSSGTSDASSGGQSGTGSTGATTTTTTTSATTTTTTTEGTSSTSAGSSTGGSSGGSSGASSGGSSGGVCSQESESCANGELCCDGLTCCEGVPVPPGKEFCGVMCPDSDRNLKTDFRALDPQEVLARVAALEVTTWRYKKDAPEVRHLGPMAQDFRAAFGLWDTDRMIFPLDAAGVSLAAIQGLHQRVVAAEGEVEALRARLAGLEARLAELEAPRLPPDARPVTLAR